MYICINNIKNKNMSRELEKINVGKSIDEDLMDMIVGGTNNVAPLGSNVPSSDCNTYTCNFKFCDYSTCNYSVCNNFNMCDYKVCNYNFCDYKVSF